LLRHDSTLQAFKHLIEASNNQGLYSGLSIITKNDEVVNFKTDSSFVFLGEENTLHFAVEDRVPKGLEVSAYNHFETFLRYINVYDFDKGERYYGHDVSSVYS
jgi:CRISPR/Cas system Type II protein with McrA/HNH and RuvC-like nuclease domain